MVLHRCRTPTDWLCPCGTVARALRSAGCEVEEVRHTRSDRATVERLTGQRKLPVVEFDDGDAVCDSLRIIDTLRRRGPD